MIARDADDADCWQPIIGLCITIPSGSGYVSPEIGFGDRDD